MAQESAVITDHTPVTPAGEVEPHWGSARKPRSSRWQNKERQDQIDQNDDDDRRGRRAAMDGCCDAAFPCAISAGSNSRAVVARSRSFSSSARLSDGGVAPSPKPSPLLFASASSRASHQKPKPSMISDARTPSPGAAKGVVPKKGIGMVFWIDGVPGMADMVKVEVPSMIAAGISLRGYCRRAEQVLRHGRDHEEGDEEADAAVGDDRSAQNDRENGALRAELLGHEIGDRRHRAAVLHQLAEQRAEQEEREELGEEARPRCA